ncbi:hypothetical protein WR25_03791 [Diploscapter pachys]|uniref:Uncharacterized protein n=1 Tax=Diploscapter pachys TaxID=2018661 RepID=A0A2A2LNL9_9BILA|nr:hypothetical protein WR25_03791 [Diploscapter pachys]
MGSSSRYIKSKPNRHLWAFNAFIRDLYSSIDFYKEEDDDSQERFEENDEETQIYQQGETRDFLQFLRTIQYDHRQLPEQEGGVLVEVSVVMSNIRDISEVTMDYCVEMFYRESWRDERLQYGDNLFRNKSEIALHESYVNYLWQPDTFIPNAIGSKNPRTHSIAHRDLLRLRNNGSILHSRRVSLVLTCAINLMLFPFDSSLCKIGFESYGYVSDQVRYAWANSIDPIQLFPIALPDFIIKEAYVTSRLESYSTGTYSRLYICFLFSRTPAFCFLQIIIPTSAVVVAAWTALWNDQETEFQDMISIILAIILLLFSYNEMMARVSYIKSMDIYLGVCFFTVFISLIKLALMKYMRQNVRKAQPIAPELTYKERLMANYSRTRKLNAVICRRHEFIFTNQFIRKFHCISQMLFMLTFLAFCFCFIFLYPYIHDSIQDDDCDRAKAEFFAIK